MVPLPFGSQSCRLGNLLCEHAVRGARPGEGHVNQVHQPSCMRMPASPLVTSSLPSGRSTVDRLSGKPSDDEMAWRGWGPGL